MDNQQNQYSIKLTQPTPWQKDLGKEIKDRSQTDFYLCYQCKACFSGCPFTEAMDYSPNQIIRLLQLGIYEEAFTSKTIWICVGCDNCSWQCPMAIDIPSIMDVLRQKNLELGLPVAMPEVYNFHLETLLSIKNYGRTHKMGIMFKYKLREGSWFQDMDVGFKMVTKRKLHLLPTKIKSIQEIRNFF